MAALASVGLLGGCFEGWGDFWYDGLATLSTTPTDPDAFRAVRSARSLEVDIRRDMGGETFVVSLDSQSRCYLTDAQLSVEPVRALSFPASSAFSCSFDTPVGPARADLTEGSGKLVDGETLSLHLTFSLRVDESEPPGSLGTLVLDFEGRARDED